MRSQNRRLAAGGGSAGPGRHGGVYNHAMKTIALAFGIVAFLIVGLFAFSTSGKGTLKPEPPGTKTAVFAVA